LFVPKNAIAAWFLDQAVTVVDPPHEFGGKLLDRLATKLRKTIDLVGRNPDITRSTRAAGPAARAREREAIFIPG
jgi:hypothetical protein